MIEKVALIGLGTMGKPMAMNILKAGFNLVVYEVRAQPLQELGRAGAKIARSAKEAAECAHLVEIAVLDDIQVEAAEGEVAAFRCNPLSTVVRKQAEWSGI